MLKDSNIILLLLLAKYLGAQQHSFPYKTEQELLLEHLFGNKRINSGLRPVRNESENLDVLIKIEPFQIIQLDERSQIMKSNIWLNFKWKDYQLSWNPDDYGGIENLRVSPGCVWKPDIFLLNSADGKVNFSWEPDVVVENNGSMLWVPPIIYKSTCKIDIEYFPFDRQSCSLQFASLNYNGAQINFTLEGVSLANIQANTSWEILDASARSEVLGTTSFHQAKVYNSEPKLFYKADLSPFVSRSRNMIIVSFHMVRMPLFYIVNLIIPCVLIAFISLWVFYLPSEAGEKISISISVLIAQVVFMLMVSKMIPTSSEKIPLISKFQLFTFLTNFVIIITTVVMINWNHRSSKTHPMSNKIRTLLIEKLPRFLFIKRPQLTSVKKITHEQVKITKELENLSSLSETESEGSSGGECSTLRDENSDVESELTFSASSSNLTESNLKSNRCVWTGGNHLPNKPLIFENLQAINNKSQPKKVVSKRLPRNLRSSMKSVNFITNHIKEEEIEKQAIDDWKFAAVVMDRLQMLIFVLAIIFGTIYILVATPLTLKNQFASSSNI